MSDAVLEKLSTVAADLVAKQSTMTRQQGSPLPPAEDLRAYDEVVPGCAADIIRAFTSQILHRHATERLVLEGSERRANRGQIIVSVLVAMVVLSGLAVALTSNGYAGAAMITAGLGSGVWLYHIGGRPPGQHNQRH
jgi:uncharacterized membrane protein